MREVLYCEEKLTGVVPEGTATIYRGGKVNWWNKQEIGRDVPELLTYFREKPTLETMCIIKDILRNYMLEKKFYFNGHTYYRYTLTREGNLKEIGITYLGIK